MSWPADAGKSQTPMSKRQKKIEDFQYCHDPHRHSVGYLGFLWDLAFGIWDFSLSSWAVFKIINNR
jgi:hypothetical protein